MTPDVRPGLSDRERSEHERRLAEMTPDELALDRDLQRLVFPGKPEYEGDFAPAPLYVTMAWRAGRGHGLACLRGFARVVEVPASPSAFGRGAAS